MPGSIRLRHFVLAASTLVTGTIVIRIEPVAVTARASRPVTDLLYSFLLFGETSLGSAIVKSEGLGKAV